MLSGETPRVSANHWQVLTRQHHRAQRGTRGVADGLQKHHFLGPRPGACAALSTGILSRQVRHVASCSSKPASTSVVARWLTVALGKPVRS